MSWAQLTNRPNNGSQRQHNSNRHKMIQTRVRTNNQNINQRHNPPRNRHKNNNPHRNHNPPRKVHITNDKKKHNDINYVILDSGAFIGRQYFFNSFDSNTKYYVTPAVEDEIRDKQSRQFLNSFPYEIIRKEPDPKSVQYGVWEISVIYISVVFCITFKF